MKVINTPATPSHLPNVPPPLHPVGETPTTTPPMVLVREKVKWEYKRIVQNLARDEAPSEDELNRLGAEGWELATIIQDSPLVYLYLKRAARE